MKRNFLLRGRIYAYNIYIYTLSRAQQNFSASEPIFRIQIQRSERQHDAT